MKIIAILACSARKKKENIFYEAENIYEGYVFKKSKKLVKTQNIPFFILSAKYGFLKPGEKIKKYNKKLSTKKDVLELIKKIKKEQTDILNIISKYEKIVILGGNFFYRSIIKTLFPNKDVFYIYGAIGILQQKIKFLEENNINIKDSLNKFFEKM